MSLRPEPDPATMRHALTFICGALGPLAQRIEADDEDSAKTLRTLEQLAANAAGLHFENDDAPATK